MDGQLVSWTVRSGGIYTCTRRDEADDTFVIALHPPGSGRVKLLEISSRTAPWFGVSPDEAFLLVERAVRSDGDIIAMRRLAWRS
jgi:hypothetical protein